TITQSGLGLPDRDYYLKGDTVYANLRMQYLAHITRLLALAGDHDAAREAHAVLEIETRIAKLHWPAAKRRERDLTWNPRTLAELEQLAPRFSWNLLLTSDGVDALDEDLGEAVGELYVQRYFPPTSRQQVLALVENLRASYAAHIEQLSWMTPETRQVALEKLAAFHPKIGYPERWRDYSGLS